MVILDVGELNKMRKLIIVICLIATPALAQEPQVTNQIYNLRVTNDEINVIGKSLGKLPFDEVAPIIQKLRTQIAEQQMPKADAVPVPKPRPSEAPQAPNPEQK